MKIAILSREPQGYTTRRLRQLCVQRGHSARVLDTLRFSMIMESGRPELLYKSEPAPKYDAVIPRIGASISHYGAAVVRHFEQMGVFTLNSSQAITVARDKLRSIQVLSRHAVGVPPTAFVRGRADVLPAIERVGGAPVIVKLLEGTQGIGVILAENTKAAEAIIETLQSARQNVLIQKFVSESKGRDVRALVVGDRVVAAMQRVALGEEFRSNVHRGGRAESIELDAQYQRTAIRAAQILGLRVAGVDMLVTSEGPQVMEVNASPGLQGIEKATREDVAETIIQHLEEQVQFPEVDLRQRLTLKSGYGVAEFQVPSNSELAGRTLSSAGMRDRDILVLSITRGSVILPNPRGDQTILPGDLLLCFGKHMTLRGLMPRKEPKRRRKGSGSPGTEHGSPA